MSVTLTNPRAFAQLAADVESGALKGSVEHIVSHAPTIGSGSSQVRLLASLAFTVDNGSPLDIDLTAVDDPSGAVVAFGRIAYFVVENQSDIVGQDLTMGGGSNPVYGSISDLPIRARGGFLQYGDPNIGTLVNGSRKTLRLTASAGTGVAGLLSLMGR